MSGWQPIETIPSTFDSTFDPPTKWVDWALLGCQDAHGWMVWVGGMDADQWIDRDSEGCCGTSLTPTHWMPLPEPPK